MIQLSDERAAHPDCQIGRTRLRTNSQRHGVGGFYIWANGSERSSDTGETSNVSATAVGALLTTAYVF
jgi:hypothetical protein